MAYDLTLFQKFLTLKGLSERYKKELMYYALRLNLYGGFNQEIINRYLLDKANQNNTARAFVELFRKFLINFKEELISNGELKKEDIPIILEVEIPQITGRKKSRINVPLTEKEMKLIEDTLETKQLKLMFLLCYHGGLRLKELMGLRVNSFDWDALRIDKEDNVGARVIGKNNKEGTVYFPNWLMKQVRDYIKEHNPPLSKDDSLFLERGKMSGRTFENKIRWVGIKSGITQKGENGEWIPSTLIHPHKFRHQLGHDLVKDKESIRFIQDVLRHTNITSTQIYTQFSKEEIKEGMKQRDKIKNEEKNRIE
jgi:integrase